MTIIKRIVKEIDKIKEQPTKIRHTPIVYKFPPKASLRYFDIILRFVLIKLQFIKLNIPPSSPVYSFNLVVNFLIVVLATFKVSIYPSKNRP